MGKPTMIDWNLVAQTGFLRALETFYAKSGSNKKVLLKDKMRVIMRIVDEQDAIGRYEWKNLPENLELTSDEIERLIYYKGQVLFFYLKSTDKYYVMPFTGCDIDFYGRYSKVTPVPISSGSAENDNYDAQKTILSALNLKVFYTIPTDADIAKAKSRKIRKEDGTETDKDYYDGFAVIIRDYPNQYNAQTIIPRFEVNEPLLDIEAEIFPMARTARLIGTGIKGMRATEDEVKNIEDGNQKMYDAAMEGSPYIGIEGSAEFQDLGNSSVTKAEEYMLGLQSLENYRLSTYGIENGGLFNKKAHELQSEANMNGGPTAARMERGHAIRSNSCDIINKLFGLQMSNEIRKYEESEVIDNEFSNDDTNGQDKEIQRDISQQG